MPTLTLNTWWQGEGEMGKVVAVEGAAVIGQFSGKLYSRWIMSINKPSATYRSSNKLWSIILTICKDSHIQPPTIIFYI